MVMVAIPGCERYCSGVWPCFCAGDFSLWREGLFFECFRMVLFLREVVVVAVSGAL